MQSIIGRLYIEFSGKLRRFNIKKNDNKCFLWCHIRHFNQLKRHPKRIAKADKKWLMILIMKVLNFLFLKKGFCKIEQKNNICINLFFYENNLVYPVHLSDQKFKDCIDLLLITEENKSHCVYIKDFNRFTWNKTKNENKKHFCNYCLQCFSSERVLIKHKENFLVVNVKQSIKVIQSNLKIISNK